MPRIWRLLIAHDYSLRQTERGRKADSDAALPFDVRVPGTLKLTKVRRRRVAAGRFDRSSTTAPGYLPGRPAKHRRTVHL